MAGLRGALLLILFVTNGRLVAQGCEAMEDSAPRYPSTATSPEVPRHHPSGPGNLRSAVDVALPAVLSLGGRQNLLLRPVREEAVYGVKARAAVKAGAIGFAVGAVAGYLLSDLTCQEDAKCGIGTPWAVVTGGILGLLIGVMVGGEGAGS